MDKKQFLKELTDYVSKSPENIISAEYALQPELTGIKMYDSPVIAVGSAHDAIYNTYKNDSRIIGPHYMTPVQWLETAASVISVFLPLSEDVKKSNTPDSIYPSQQWLHARIEGQEFINGLSAFSLSLIKSKGYDAVCPSLSQRFKGGEPNGNKYTSNWSERHAAYACGLGTFGLSKGIITVKGMAGRLTSFILSASMDVDSRPYTHIYEYCTLCGKCVKNCPANAITLEEGKDHGKCDAFLSITKEKFAPRYGCGKCQTYVPCQSKIPKKQYKTQ